MQINSKRLTSLLALEFTEPSLDMIVGHNLPLAIYKDFDEEDHRKSFLNGNIWFSGPNQNRYFLENVNRRDKFEYQNSIGTFLWEYSLSFSVKRPALGRPAIKVVDIAGFLQAMKNDIEKSKNKYHHNVSWLPLDNLKHYISLAQINIIKKYPTQDNECVILQVCGIGGDYVTYEDKILDLKGDYDGIRVANNARNKNMDYKDEKEWRIRFNTGDFLELYTGNMLHHLVQYLKLKCPSISKYCELI